MKGAFALAGVAVVIATLALTLAIIGLVRQPPCVPCGQAGAAPVIAAAPEPAAAPTAPPPPVPEPLVEPVPVEPVPAVEPLAATPPPRPTVDKLDQLRDVADRLGFTVRALAADYPASLPAKVTARTRIEWEWPGVDDTMDDLLARAKLSREHLSDPPVLATVDDAARALFEHAEWWLPRWRAQARYFQRGEFRDDQLARGRRDDADIRASLAKANELYAALAAAIDPLWRERLDAIATRAPASDLAAFDRMWEACRTVALSSVAGRPDRAALTTAVRACRAEIDAVRARRLPQHEASFVIQMLESTASADPDSAAASWLFAAQLAAQMRPKLSEAQAEAP